MRKVRLFRDCKAELDPKGTYLVKTPTRRLVVIHVWEMRDTDLVYDPEVGPVTRRPVCDRCDGFGYLLDPNRSLCPECAGLGYAG